MRTRQRQHWCTALLPLFTCLLAFLVTGCSLPGNNDTPIQKQLTKAPLAKQTYTIPETGIFDFTTLDPALASDPASIRVIQMLYTGLVQMDNKLQIQPQLAQSWKQEKDGVTWTFRLKQNVKFHDGTPLTARDVAYSIDRALQPTTKSTTAPIYLGLIKHADQLLAGRVSTLIGDSIRTPDPSTITIETSKPAAYFLAMLTYPSSYVVQKSLLDTYGAQFTDHLNEGGGAGPFKVTKYTRRVGIDLIPNTNYYNARPQLQKVSILFYRTPEQTYQAYKENKLDLAPVPLDILNNQKKTADFRQTPQLWINYYALNYLTPPFNNINIRKAFALAIDKTALAKNAWQNTVQPTNHILPQGLTGYNAELTGPDGTKNLSGNPKLAQDLLKQGLTEEKLTTVTDLPPIRLTYVSGIASMDREVTGVVQMWQKVLGVQVVPDPVDYETLLDKVTAATGNAKGIQMWSLAWVGQYPDPQDWLTRQFGKGSPNNNMNYGNNVSMTAARQQLVQQALDSADAMTKQETRISSYQQAEQQIINDVAWIPTAQVTSTFLRNPNIVGIVDNAQNFIPPNDWAKIYRVQ